MWVGGISTVNQHNTEGKGCVFPRPGRLWPLGRVHGIFAPNIMEITVSNFMMKHLLYKLITYYWDMIFASVKLTRLTLVLPGTTIIALYATTKRVSIFNACAEILRLRSIHKSLEGAVKLSRYTKLSTFELPGRALFVAGKASAGPATKT